MATYPGYIPDMDHMRIVFRQNQLRTLPALAQRWRQAGITGTPPQAQSNPPSQPNQKP